MMKKLKDNMTSKDWFKYYKKYPRDRWELYLNLHNRKFELIRTIGSMLAVVINTIVLLKVFGKI